MNIVFHTHFTPMQNTLLFSFFHMLKSKLLRSMSCHNAVNLRMNHRGEEWIHAVLQNYVFSCRTRATIYIINYYQIIPPSFFCFWKTLPYQNTWTSSCMNILYIICWNHQWPFWNGVTSKFNFKIGYSWHYLHSSLHLRAL